MKQAVSSFDSDQRPAWKPALSVGAAKITQISL